jgi:hypothetical protein
MPIDISEFREPTFIKMQERYPLSTDKKDRFIKFDTYPRNYRGVGGTFPQAGYNPHHQSTRVEKINLESDDYTLKSR